MRKTKFDKTCMLLIAIIIGFEIIAWEIKTEQLACFVAIIIFPVLFMGLHMTKNSGVKHNSH